MGIPLNAVDRQILTELSKGRCTPMFLAEQTGKSTTYVQDRLRRFREHSYVKRPSHALYEITDKGKDRLVDHDS